MYREDDFTRHSSASERRRAFAYEDLISYRSPYDELRRARPSFDLYKPKWTQTIQDEWKRNLLKKRPDLKTGQLDKTILEMNKAFPDASVEQYEILIPTFDLPDIDDCHLLAVAVRCHAEVIVTSNLKHFPEKYLSEFEIEAQHPDHFITNLIDLNPEKSLEAFGQQVSFLKNPPMTASQVLDSLEKAGLSITCTRLRIKMKNFSGSRIRWPRFCEMRVIRFSLKHLHRVRAIISTELV